MRRFWHVHAGGADKVGFRTYGKSKDSRDDLPQVVIGMAVTRDGIPVRVWCWPGNTADSRADPPGPRRHAGLDPGAGRVGRRPRVLLRENRRYLRRGGGHYIIGEKLRSGSAEATAALSRQGRYQHVARQPAGQGGQGSPTTERFVICFNPEAADRDAAIREQSGRPARRADRRHRHADRRRSAAELRGGISTKPGLNRFLRVTPGGLLRIDKAKVAAEANLDGKYLLRCSDPHLSAEDIALGYKQLLEVERGWRDMKTILDLRPVYHRLEDRIRAHVLLCWLALLLVRIVETTTGHTWATCARRTRPAPRRHLHRPRRHVPAAHRAHHAQRDILAKLGIPHPRRSSNSPPQAADQHNTTAWTHASPRLPTHSRSNA